MDRQNCGLKPRGTPEGSKTITLSDGRSERTDDPLQTTGVSQTLLVCYGDEREKIPDQPA
jgi:hypothetical protein